MRTRARVLVTVLVGLTAAGCAHAPSGNGRRGTTASTSGTPSSVLALSAVSCPSDVECVAVGGQGWVARTGDGGRSPWEAHRVAPALRLVSVACPSSASCVAVGQEPSTARSPSRQFATRTEALVSHDGGVTWSSHQIVTGLEAVSSVSCPDAGRCWVVGTTARFALAVYRSGDGGTGWASVAVPPGIGAARAVDCSGPAACVVLAASIDRPEDVAPTDILSTTDGGRRWHVVGLPAVARGNNLPFAMLDSVTCPTVGLCLAAGGVPSGGMNSGYPAMYRSVDGGQSWQAVDFGLRTLLPSPVDAGDFLDAGVPAVVCSSSSSCTAVVSAVDATMLALTSDGGATWRTTVLPPSTPPCADCTARGPFESGAALACPDEQHCWAVGTAIATSVRSTAAVAVLATADGWKTWASERVST